MTMTENANAINLLIPAPLAQAIVSYLETKPFVEVHQLIAGLLRLPRFEGPISAGDAS